MAKGTKGKTLHEDTALRESIEVSVSQDEMVAIKKSIRATGAGSASAFLRIEALQRCRELGYWPVNGEV